MVNTWICTSDDHPICFFITKPERHMWTANAAVDDNWVPCMAGYRGERPKDRVRGVWQNLFWGGPYGSCTGSGGLWSKGRGRTSGTQGGGSVER